jgi:voltage-gated potassium channel
MVHNQALSTLRKQRGQYLRMLLASLWTPATVFIAVVGNAILVAAVCTFHWLEADLNPSVDSWLDSLWWGLATVTTVGFGDVVPITDAGRIVGMVLMLAGVSMFVGFTALVATGFSAGIQEEIAASERLTYREYERVMVELERIDRRLEAIAEQLEERG